MVKWRRGNLWLLYDLYVVGQRGVLCRSQRGPGPFTWPSWSNHVAVCTEPNISHPSKSSRQMSTRVVTCLGFGSSSQHVVLVESVVSLVRAVDGSTKSPASQRLVLVQRTHIHITARCHQGGAGKVKYPYIRIALYRDSSLKRSGMARVNEGSHSFSCHQHVYPQVEWTIPAFTPQPQSITALWLVLISRPAEGRRLSWRRWLGEIMR